MPDLKAIKKTMRVEQTVETVATIRLNAENIVALLAHSGLIVENEHAHAEVTFTVPRGGDFSGDSIEIDDEHPVVVMVMQRTTTKEK